MRRIEREHRGSKLPLGLFRHVVDEKRVLVGGAISNAGNLRAWCVRELRVDDDQALDRRLAANDALTVLPFWVRERAPTWPDELGGTIREVTQATTADEILRAATTSTYYRLADILEELKPRPSHEVIISGGILKSPSSLGILADCLGRDVQVCRELESSIRGAAVYALEKLGCAPKPLRPGRIVRHDPKLTREHQKRRSRQKALEELLS
ncbi:MAG TPA: FGGY-family carbohydrate kinase [Chthoniobacterales bacterium]|nr:FGGY-family carbohydrate kinase [Chthoniobacterales bacterium]